MIKSITITNHLNESIRLELTRPELSGFVVMSIEGLGPPKGTINTTELSTSDGGLFNSSRISQRNIVLDLIFFNTSYETIEMIRHKSYKYFPVKKKIRFTVETDIRTTFIDGYVESNEPDIFSDREGCQISVICPYPYFALAEGNVVVPFTVIEPSFEFPFSDNSYKYISNNGDMVLTQGLPTLEMSSLSENTIKVIVYEGDVDVGITIKMIATGEVSNVTIYNLETRETMRIDTDKMTSLTGSGIVTGDEITISTSKSRKSVTLFRNGRNVNILNCLDRDADWFTLIKGDNIFSYVAESGQSNLQFTIEHQVIYEGV